MTELVPVHNNDITPLSVPEAEKLDGDIVAHADSLRELLVEMYERSGWAALGFDSWQTYLKDVSARAGVGSKQLRKIHNVARLEASAGFDLGSFREGSIRPIIDGLSNAKGYTDEDRVSALELAVELAGDTTYVTGSIAQAAASYIIVEKSTPSDGRRLVSRMKHGEIPPMVAAEICEIMNTNAAQGLGSILAEVSYAKLAAMLVSVRQTGGDIWEDLKTTITHSGTIPTGDERQVATSAATPSDLIEYLNAPTRLKRYEKAVERTQLLTEVAKTAAKVMIEYYGVVGEPVSETLGLNKLEFVNEIKLYSLLLSGGFIRHGQ